MNIIQSKDASIRDLLQEKSLQDTKYWSFKGRSKRTQCHALIQYPAMMVPEMQGELIDAIMLCDSNISSIYDPFVGSGTTLGEALIRGLNFGGTDINPLAILACEVKSGPFYLKSLKYKIKSLFKRIESDPSNNIDVNFFGRDKWFTEKVQIELCKIRRAIKLEDRKWARKFFWVALSDTVRATCNSRSSTYKLHIKEVEKINEIGNPIDIFKKNITRNSELRADQKDILKYNKFLKCGRHSSTVNVFNEDVRERDSRLCNKYDLLVTSPPYGDNGTTVPYGQFSYLPLQWIDANDINQLLSNKLLANSNSIDFAGLGGSKSVLEEQTKDLKSKSKSFERIYNKLPQGRGDFIKRYSSFFRDLDSSLPCILSKLRPEAYMIWTLGNRTIAGQEIPLNIILKELLEYYGCRYVHSIDREIPSKKMASRNNASKTMTNETVLIMQLGHN